MALFYKRNQKLELNNMQITTGKTKSFTILLKNDSSIDELC